MKTRYHSVLLALALLAGARQAAAQGSAFNYQGQLNSNSVPVNGHYDFEFSLFSASVGGSQIGSTLSQANIGVTNGLFATTLDFGPVFTGNDTWLAISVRSNGIGGYTALTPLQELNPTPYAIFATTAGQVNGTIPLSQLPATVGLLSDPGTLNFFAGQDAGNLTLSGSDNTGVGHGALASDTSGNYNTATGVAALGNNSTGRNNSAFGDDALSFNDVGTNNVAVGASALGFNRGGYNNTATGAAALIFNTTGANNTANGANAMYGGGSGTGVGNTANGSSSLYYITTGYNNTAAGYEALYANSTGVDNVGVGVATFQANSTGSLNTGVGTYAFQLLTAGAANIGLGYHAGYFLTSGSNNIYVGNLGASAENGVIRLGDSANQTNTYIAGTVHASGGLQVDTADLDIGTVNDNSTLLFGGNTGEGIGSVRSSGYDDSYGLDFYTDFDKRMTIKQNGYVGIGTDNPSQALEVDGEFMMVDGLGGVKCYIGDDGFGNDVQVGSLTSGVTSVSFYNATDNAAMHINCSSITIQGGADLAEPFSISTPDKQAPEGAVVVIDEENPGHLKVSDRPYDTRVAGVISGANGIHPGIQMEQQGALEGGQNVALTGRVYVQADASYGAIRPGDMLTTSKTPGYAMKVIDHARAQGAILGKAMTGLISGKGKVLTLVTLQ